MNAGFCNSGLIHQLKTTNCCSNIPQSYIKRLIGVTTLFLMCSPLSDVSLMCQIRCFGSSICLHLHVIDLTVHLDFVLLGHSEGGQTLDSPRYSWPNLTYLCRKYIGFVGCLKQTLIHRTRKLGRYFLACMVGLMSVITRLVAL